MTCKVQRMTQMPTCFLRTFSVVADLLQERSTWHFQPAARVMGPAVCRQAYVIRNKRTNNEKKRNIGKIAQSSTMSTDPSSSTKHVLNIQSTCKGPHHAQKQHHLSVHGPQPIIQEFAHERQITVEHFFCSQQN